MGRKIKAIKDAKMVLFNNRRQVLRIQHRLPNRLIRVVSLLTIFILWSCGTSKRIELRVLDSSKREVVDECYIVWYNSNGESDTIKTEGNSVLIKIDESKKYDFGAFSNEQVKGDLKYYNTVPVRIDFKKDTFDFNNQVTLYLDTVRIIE